MRLLCIALLQFFSVTALPLLAASSPMVLILTNPESGLEEVEKCLRQNPTLTVLQSIHARLDQAELLSFRRLMFKQCLQSGVVQGAYSSALAEALLADPVFLAKSSLSVVLLLRHPRQTMASLFKKTQNAAFTTIDYRGLWKVYQEVYRVKGEYPLVIDQEEFVKDPRASLEILCEYAKLPFCEKMTQGAKALDEGQAEHREIRAEADPFRQFFTKDRDMLEGFYRAQFPYYQMLKCASLPEYVWE